jgi:hypothetical protein
MEVFNTMRKPDLETQVLVHLWPFKPFDAARVSGCAILLSLFGSNGGAPSGWHWFWGGTALGLTIVLIQVRRRVRSGSYLAAEPSTEECCARATATGH